MLPLFIFLIIRPPPRSNLFPYTTLFRSAVYPGATAQDVATAVAAPIEQQLSGLDGLLYFKSSNSSAGVMNLSVYFDVSRNPDLAAVDVQNQIALAEPQLPQEVVRNGITVQ